MACLVPEMYTEMENIEKERHDKTMLIKELQQEIEAQDKVGQVLQAGASADQAHNTLRCTFNSRRFRGCTCGHTPRNRSRHLQNEDE